MRKITLILVIILWLIPIAIATVMISQHGLWSIAPVFAHNKPYGIIGWGFTVAIIANIIRAVYYLFHPITKTSD